MSLKWMTALFMIAINAAAVSPGEYPPDPTELSRTMHWFAVQDFRESSRDMSVEQSRQAAREANERFWRDVMYARESGYGLP